MADFALNRKNRAGPLVAYGVMILVTALSFLLINKSGSRLSAPSVFRPEVQGPAAVTQSSEALVHVLIALIAIIVLARLLGAAFRFIHQPPVMGEILAGILLGPSLLGRIAPEAYHYLLPGTVAPYLGILSQVGVLLYMFLVGMELDANVLRASPHATLVISHASITAPFVLGATLALWIYPILSNSGVSFTAFALFMGVSMSVTAFPVLARILTDRRMQRTQLGVTALACAAVGDVTAWCLLALLVSFVQAGADSALYTVVLTIGFIMFNFLVVRRVMAWYVARHEDDAHISQGVLSVTLGWLLLSALATELIGIHAIFGAFLAGAVIPHESKIAKVLTERLQDLVVVLLLPAFFAFTGMRTQIGLISGAGNWLLCLSIIVVASVGKFGGSLFAGRLVGLTWQEGSALAILMNTRGLMELIVLNIGYDLGIISSTLFAMLVIMALVTTFGTTPILHWIMQIPKRVTIPANSAGPSHGRF